MSIFMKLGDVKGEETDAGHGDWIVCESLSASVFVQPPDEQLGEPGETTLGDVEVLRLLDDASARLLESCADGRCFEDVEIHVYTPVGTDSEPYQKYKLKNVVISGYLFFHAVATGDPPSEEITMNCTEAEWTFAVIDPVTGEKTGSVSVAYSPGVGGRQASGERDS